MVHKRSPDAIDVFVGGRIRMRRMMLKLSQTQLANELGVTFQQVQKYEKGTNRVGASRLQKIANVLGVPPSFFFYQESKEPVTTAGVGDFTTMSYVSQFLQSREGMALNQSFLKIPDANVRQKIVALVKAMAEMDELLPIAPEGRSSVEVRLNS